MEPALHIALNTALLSFLAVLGFAIARTRNLFSAIIMTSAFSMVMALQFTLLDAPDVAFTEAAIGAGLSIVLFLAAMSLIVRREKKPAARPLAPLAAVLLTGALLIYGTLDLPPHGSPDAPAQTHVAPDYIARAPGDTGVPNVVTAVLAAYRGFDTLGEVYVILAAGIAVLALLAQDGLMRRRPERRS